MGLKEAWANQAQRAKEAKSMSEDTMDLRLPLDGGPPEVGKPSGSRDNIRSTDRTITFNKAEVQALEVLVGEAKQVNYEREGSLIEFYVLDHLLNKVSCAL